MAPATAAKTPRMRTEALIAILFPTRNLPAMRLFGLFSKRHPPKFAAALGEEPSP